MAIDVSAEVVISRRRDEVAAFVMNPANDATWIAAVRHARVVDGRPLAKGARVERTSRFLGRRVEQVMEVTGYAPPTRLALDSVRGPIPMRVSYQLDELGDDTRARVQLQGKPGAVFRLARPMLVRLMKHTVSRDLRALKRHLEEA